MKPCYKYSHKTKTWRKWILSTNGIINPKTGEYNTFMWPADMIYIGGVFAI